MMKSLNVLVTGIGGPIAQGILMGLKKLNHVTIIGVDRRALTSGHHFCDKTYQISRYTNLPEYKKAILNIVQDENIDAVFPALHPEVKIFAEFREEIPAVVAIPKSSVFSVLENKVDTYKYLEEQGFKENLPEYYAFNQNSELQSILSNKFAELTHVVVKNAEAYGAIGSAILTDHAHYIEALDRNQPHVLDVEDYYAMSSCEGVERLVMPYIQATEYSVDVFLHDQEVVVAVPRIRAGVSSGLVLEGEVVYDKELIEIATKIAEALAGEGFINLQFFKTEKGLKLIDVNPRFAGSQVMSLGAGVNFPEIFLRYKVFGEKMDIQPKWNTKMYRYRVPVFYHEGELEEL